MRLVVKKHFLKFKNFFRFSLHVKCHAFVFTKKSGPIFTVLLQIFPFCALLLIKLELLIPSRITHLLAVALRGQSFPLVGLIFQDETAAQM